MPKRLEKTIAERERDLADLGGALFISGLRSSIEVGEIDPRGKTDQQLFEEFISLLESVDFNVAITTDHTVNLLARARAACKQGHLEITFLFYSLWAEHMLNKFIFNIGMRCKFPRKQIDMLIRETNIRGKFLWIHLSLSLRAPSNGRMAAISELAERRNQFVHYKWKADKEENESADKKTISSTNSLVRYLREFDNRHFLYNHGKRIKSQKRSFINRGIGGKPKRLPLKKSPL